jgi:hypothetical protein
LDLVCIWPNIETIRWINGRRIPISNVVRPQFTSALKQLTMSTHMQTFEWNTDMKLLGGWVANWWKKNHSTGHWTLWVLIIGYCWKNDLWLLRPKLFQGVLAQAKNGDKFFWEEKFLQSIGRPKQTLKVPCFFSF